MGRRLDFTYEELEEMGSPDCISLEELGTLCADVLTGVRRSHPNDRNPDVRPTTLATFHLFRIMANPVVVLGLINSLRAARGITEPIRPSSVIIPDWRVGTVQDDVRRATVGGPTDSPGGYGGGR